MKFLADRPDRKTYASIFGILIMVMLVIWYSSFLARNLRNGERERVELLAKAFADILKDGDNPDRDVSLASDIIEANKTIPLILTDEETGEVMEAINFPEAKSMDEIAEELERIKSKGIKGITYSGPGYRRSIFYKESELFRYMTYFPYFILFVLLTFMGIGYVSVTSARQAEQNRVWVGLAKETAHQLGTPISAIVAWIEHLRGLSQNDPAKLDILGELENDVDRLDLIADRFSKIGSAPKLVSANVYHELLKTKVYMERRAPRRVKFDFPDRDSAPMYISINSHLFNWVMENLIRNSLDAMEGEGTISVEVDKQGSFVCINVSDSGKGIPQGLQKKVFTPGFTTKKRGWGLGLSLARRIIEEYHGGKIFVKESSAEKGTTFSIKLPAGEPITAENSTEVLVGINK